MKKENEEISIKNTKAEILEALNIALKREKEMAKVKANPEKEQIEKKTTEAIKETKENLDKNIFSDELINKFRMLEVAIEAEENKLKELYGVEKELNNLTLIVNANKDFSLSLETARKNKEIAINNEIVNLEKEYKAKEEDIKKMFEELSKNLKIERDRETEEYNYKQKREREIENNKWEDDKKKRLIEITIKEEETKKLLNEAKEKTEQFVSLEKEVANIPELLQKATEKAKKDAITEMERNYKFEKDLLNCEYKNTIDRQNDRIDSLTKEIERLTIMNAALQEKTDKAYGELKELATKTVVANGGVKIIGSNGNDSKL